MHQRLIQPRSREKTQWRRRNGKIHEVVLRNIPEDGGDHFAYADLAGHRLRFRYAWKTWHAPQTEPDVIARFWPCFDQSFSFEVIVGLKGSAHADAVFLAEHADGRQFVAYFQRLVADQLFQPFRYLHINGIVACEFSFMHRCSYI